MSQVKSVVRTVQAPAGAFLSDIQTLRARAIESYRDIDSGEMRGGHAGKETQHRLL